MRDHLAANPKLKRLSYREHPGDQLDRDEQGDWRPGRDRLADRVVESVQDVRRHGRRDAEEQCGADRPAHSLELIQGHGAHGSGPLTGLQVLTDLRGTVAGAGCATQPPISARLATLGAMHTEGVTVADDATWLSLGEVVARFRAAGYSDSESTIRRLIDDGEIESYRVERRGGGRGHRRMRAASVDTLLDRRRRGGVAAD